MSFVFGGMKTGGLLLYILFRPFDMRSSKTRPWIGRSEVADFPALGIFGLPVKIDTGAYNSSIHCESAIVNSGGLLEAVFLDRRHRCYSGEVHRFSDFAQKTVKSSNGKAEKRFLISTAVEFADKIYTIDLSLADRGDMRFPVLIGRKFLKLNYFVVDPRRRGLLGSSPSETKTRRRY